VKCGSQPEKGFRPRSTVCDYDVVLRPPEEPTEHHRQLDRLLAEGLGPDSYKLTPTDASKFEERVVPQTELQRVEGLLQLMRKYGAIALTIGDLHAELGGEPREPVRVKPWPDTELRRLEHEGVPTPPEDPKPPYTDDEILYASTPLGPPDKIATRPMCVACGGAQGLDVTGRPMCYGCGAWDLMPADAQEKHPERTPTD
jgi:hypothetical protein